VSEGFSLKSLGKYTISGECGRGGMAVVYKAEDQALGRVVALKVLSSEASTDPGATTRFEREARVTAKLNHPNIIKIFDIGRSDGYVFFAMEYLPHASIYDTIKNEGKFTVDRAIEVVQQVLKGLQAAHDAGVVHRDIKPENIMLNKEEQVVLVDFGIAKTKKGARLTQTGILLGTPYYMSPEQITGKEVKHTSDIYSTGVVLYELLTAKVPFQADSTFMISYMHCTQEAPDPREHNSEISDELKKVIFKSMSKDPNKRYENAVEMWKDLERVRQGDHVEAEDVDDTEKESHPEYIKAMASYRAGDFESAYKHFISLSNEPIPPENGAEAQRWAGSCLYDQKRYSEAVIEFKKVVDKWPETEEARRIPVFIDGCCFEQLSRGEMLNDTGKSQQALDELSTLLTTLESQDIPLDNNLWSQHAKTKVEQIRKQIEHKKFVKSAAIVSVLAFVSAIAGLIVYFYWINPFARYSVAASVYSARKRYFPEQAALNEALKLKPDDSKVLFRLARSMLLSGASEQKVEQTLIRSISADMTYGPAFELLGELFGRQSKWKKANEAMMTAQKNGLKSPRFLTNLGHIKAKCGFKDEAVKLYKKALDEDPGYAMAYNNLGVYHLQNDDAQLALKCLQQAVRTEPDLAEPLHNMGRLYYNQMVKEQKKAVPDQKLIKKFSDQAYDNFTKALLISPERADCLYHKALIAISRKDFSGARDSLLQALDLIPDDGPMNFEYAQLLLNNDDTKGARLYLERAVSASPSEVKYRLALAGLMERLRLWTEAAKNYDVLITLFPENVDFYIRKTFALKKEKNFDKALITSLSAVKKFPGNLPLMAEVGELLWLLKRLEQASAIVKKVLVEAPEVARYNQLLADIEMDRGSYGIAEKLYARISVGNSEKTLFISRRARCLIELGRYREAEDLYNKVLVLDKTNVDALNGLGFLYVKQRRMKEAIVLLTKSRDMYPFQLEISKIRDALAEIGN